MAASTTISGSGQGNLFSNIFGGGKSETANFTGEPARSALTDPPPGYQTPSPNQPYGLSKRNDGAEGRQRLRSRASRGAIAPRSGAACEGAGGQAVAMRPPVQIFTAATPNILRLRP